ncbi:ankyrin repeat-containing domain protein [Podospora conica]|nr:ankyrin repeat-containing domain protein [Schizothecium conicum]
MRLINVHDYSMRVFWSRDIPEYSILSHTWGDNEVTFQDMRQLDGYPSREGGLEKIRFACEQSARDGLDWTWVDTCCINKADSTELNEAINTMFAWYHGAARCYVYLSDVSTSSTMKSDFPATRWFTRGWTLQELLAPRTVQFFARDGTLLGDKTSLLQQIHEITGIPIPALQGDSLANFSVEERFTWAKNRQTTRDEDWAYSLLGIFGVFIPLIYGEGKDRAVRRIKVEIDNNTRIDHQDLKSELLDSALIGDTAKARQLLEKGADVDARHGVNRRTPLHLAVLNEHLETAELLLQKGANVNARDMWGEPPLRHAVLLRHVEIVKLLMKYQADPKAKDIWGETPLDVTTGGDLPENQEITSCLQGPGKRLGKGFWGLGFLGN